MKIKSNIAEFEKLLKRATLTGMKRAAIFYHSKCRVAVNVPNTGETRQRVRDTTAQGGGPPGSQYTVYKNPSAPGEAPHKITGTGQSHIVQETNDNPNDPRARVGVSKGGLHMAMLELGTKNIDPRPWLGVNGVLGKHYRMIGRLAVTGGGKIK